MNGSSRGSTWVTTAVTNTSSVTAACCVVLPLPSTAAGSLPSWPRCSSSWPLRPCCKRHTRRWCTGSTAQAQTSHNISSNNSLSSSSSTTASRNHQQAVLLLVQVVVWVSMAAAAAGCRWPVLHPTSCVTPPHCPPHTWPVCLPAVVLPQQWDHQRPSSELMLASLGSSNHISNQVSSKSILTSSQSLNDSTSLNSRLQMQLPPQPRASHNHLQPPAALPLPQEEGSSSSSVVQQGYPAVQVVQLSSTMGARQCGAAGTGRGTWHQRGICSGVASEGWRARSEERGRAWSGVEERGCGVWRVQECSDRESRERRAERVT